MSDISSQEDRRSHLQSSLSFRNKKSENNNSNNNRNGNAVHSNGLMCRKRTREERTSMVSKHSCSNSRPAHSKIVYAPNANPLDNTWIHPENYDTTLRLIQASGTSLEDLGTAEFTQKMKQFVSKVPIDKLLDELKLDKPTLKLIVDGITTPTGKDIISFLTDINGIGKYWGIY